MDGLFLTEDDMKILENKIDALEKRLAAAESHNAIMREALEFLKDNVEGGGYDYNIIERALNIASTK